MQTLTLAPEIPTYRSPASSIPAARAVPPNTPPGRLLVMVFDAANRFLATAETGYMAGLPAAAEANVHQAQRILVELMGALDRAFAPDATDALTRLCQHVFDDLSDAAARRDPARIAAARHTLRGLREAFE